MHHSIGAVLDGASFLCAYEYSTEAAPVQITKLNGSKDPREIITEFAKCAEEESKMLMTLRKQKAAGRTVPSFELASRSSKASQRQLVSVLLLCSCLSHFLFFPFLSSFHLFIYSCCYFLIMSLASSGIATWLAPKLRSGSSSRDGRASSSSRDRRSSSRTGA